MGKRKAMSEGAKITTMPCGKSLPRTDSAEGPNDSKIDQYNLENVQRVALGARVLEKPLHKSLRECDVLINYGSSLY